jgi:hypothetical protein
VALSIRCGRATLCAISFASSRGALPQSIEIGRKWLNFVGRLETVNPPAPVFAHQIRELLAYLRQYIGSAGNARSGLRFAPLVRSAAVQGHFTPVP